MLADVALCWTRRKMSEMVDKGNPRCRLFPSCCRPARTMQAVNKKAFMHFPV